MLLCFGLNSTGDCIQDKHNVAQIFQAIGAVSPCGVRGGWSASQTHGLKTSLARKPEDGGSYGSLVALHIWPCSMSSLSVMHSEYLWAHEETDDNSSRSNCERNETAGRGQNSQKISEALSE
eukprot:4396540-Amphidinium_carterae.1